MGIPYLDCKWETRTLTANGKSCNDPHELLSGLSMVKSGRFGGEQQTKRASSFVPVAIAVNGYKTAHWDFVDLPKKDGEYVFPGVPLLYSAKIVQMSFRAGYKVNRTGDPAWFSAHSLRAGPLFQNRSDVREVVLFVNKHEPVRTVEVADIHLPGVFGSRCRYDRPSAVELLVSTMNVLELRGWEEEDEVQDAHDSENLKGIANYLSRRRKVVLSFVNLARKKCDRKNTFRALGLTATPVINNLKEAQSLLCIVSGLDYSHLKCRSNPNLDECMAVHRALALHGIRFLLEYAEKNPAKIEHPGNKQLEWIDAKEQYDAVQSNKFTCLESALARTKAKLNFISEKCKAFAEAKKQVLIYTHYYGGGILEALMAKLRSVRFKRGGKEHKLKVCAYTGRNARTREKQKRALSNDV